MLTFLDGFPFPPPPPGTPEYVPGPVETFFAFMLAYLLLVMCVLLILPHRWTDWIFLRDEK